MCTYNVYNINTYVVRILNNYQYITRCLISDMLLEILFSQLATFLFGGRANSDRLNRCSLIENNVWVPGVKECFENRQISFEKINKNMLLKK